MGRGSDKCTNVSSNHTIPDARLTPSLCLCLCNHSGLKRPPNTCNEHHIAIVDPAAYSPATYHCADSCPRGNAESRGRLGIEEKEKQYHAWPGALSTMLDPPSWIWTCSETPVLAWHN
jgi:hypothetical protein